MFVKITSINIESTIFNVDGNIINIRLAKCRNFYDILVDKKTKLPASINFWISIGIPIEERIKTCLEMCRQATKETSLIAMQFKILHNIIATNQKLKVWGITDSDKCTYCNRIDTLDHSLWECNSSKNVIHQCLTAVKQEHLMKKKDDFLLGSADIAVDNLALIIKYYLIYLRKHNKPFNRQNFLKEIKIRWLADKDNIKNPNFYIKWSLIDQLQDSIEWKHMFI